MKARVSHSSQSMPQILILKNTLRRKIGWSVVLGDIFTPKRMQECQQIVDHAYLKLLDEMKEEIDGLADAYTKASKDPAAAEPIIKQTIPLAFSIKKRMEELGFSLGFEVAQSLYNYIKAATRYHPDVMVVVCKHAAILQIVLENKITDDGGATGQELILSLRKLIRKKKL